MSYRLGALDYCHMSATQDSSNAVRNSLALVNLLQQYGYSRFWITEHHSLDVAHAAPELLTAIAVAGSEEIRIGPAGILLQYYSPLKVAETFSLLNLLYPGRIDLGLAHGLLPDELGRLLGPGTLSTPYEVKIAELLSYLRGNSRIVVTPRPQLPGPEVWLLGGRRSARMAARNGSAFCLGHFFKSSPISNGREIIDEYRDQFEPTSDLGRPKWCVAVAVACAETERRAHEAVRGMPEFVQATAIGDPSQCKMAIKKVCSNCATNEIVIFDLCNRFEDRVESYRLLAQEFGVDKSATSQQYCLLARET